MRSAVLAVALGSAALAGCASRYEPGWEFGPRTGPRPVSGPVGRAGRVDAAVVGVRENDVAGRAAIDVSVRVERFGDAPLALDGDSLRLVAGPHRLAPSSVTPRRNGVAPRGGAETWDVTFPLPTRDPAGTDLAAVAIEVPVDVGGRAERVDLRFDRIEPAFLWTDPWGWPGPDFTGHPQGWRR